MRVAIAFLAAVPLMAQQTPSPVPVSEQIVTGWVEAGYRWNTGIAGSNDTYRSVVNLGSGFKLIGADFTFLNPRRRSYLDRIHVQASDWKDPYSTLRIDAAREPLYRLSVSFRSLAYFNNLPSFADPLLARGIVLNEQSFDTKRRLGAVDLQLLPTHRVTPYIGFDNDSSDGHGVNTFVTTGNEYAVPYNSNDRTRLYRGGMRINLRRLKATVEEGSTTYRTDENTLWSGLNFGNTSTPYLGQALDLTSLSRALAVRGSGAFTRIAASSSPTANFELHAQFAFTQASNRTQFQQSDTGTLLLVLTQQAQTKLPHTSAEAGWQLRPGARLRIDQIWLTDRLHNTATEDIVSALLASNYSHVETNVFVDAGARLTLRGGYRYVWADSMDPVLPRAGLHTVTESSLHRNVWLASATWKALQRFSVTGDLEAGVSHGDYFRTSLHDYRKLRVNGRYEIARALHANASYTILTNRNPLAGSPYISRYHDEALTLSWNPSAGKLSADATWEHCGYRTEISFLDPTYLLGAVSKYREDCHSVTSLISAALPHKINFAAGGSALWTAGSRPNTWYQPTARINVPIARNAAWFAEWRYYGFGENFYLYENFRTHLFTTGLRLSR